MKRAGSLPFAIAGILFAIYLGNVILGSMRAGVFLKDVGEMIVLFGACVFFVVAVLIRERAAAQTNSKKGGEPDDREFEI
jgi:hypothetical protein